ncbi:ArsR/SmtB family transcription factor [Ilumatobacter coccineus]|uniref:Putative ArsR family transcriptional regulator n=1 Tax=Ilumatobacter coccineus (strain NBRC 103263 / KCTC 29153 / YM16-304) TaxID=1313172 RepID=A0A6C7E1W8_ILUCY|nr:metalloregulator ArsR/SmtB family transcription factor [Ilumatobacter coccineus]BAN02124.1 putative ArsR family transcriptional regulator [Ilumatobacter coccineus YM16-304]
MSDSVYRAKAEFFKVLGHPVRVRVIEVLAGGPRSVSAMQPDVGVESAHLSQQLAIMRRAGIVGAERQGSSMIYSVLDPQIFELLGVAKQIIMTRLANDGELLADMDAVSYEQRR